MAFYFYTIIRTLSIGILVNITNICKNQKKNIIKNRPLRGHWNIPRNQVKKSRGFSPLDSLLLYIFSYFIIQLFSLKIFLSILLNTRFR